MDPFAMECRTIWLNFNLIRNPWFEQYQAHWHRTSNWWRRSGGAEGVLVFPRYPAKSGLALTPEKRSNKGAMMGENGTRSRGTAQGGRDRHEERQKSVARPAAKARRATSGCEPPRPSRDFPSLPTRTKDWCAAGDISRRNVSARSAPCPSSRRLPRGGSRHSSAARS